jgi:hypothetical protein
MLEGRDEQVLAAERPAFARAVRAIINGEVAALRSELAASPELVHARSGSGHRATLLHYVAANGIEDELQRQVPNADEIARILLAAGAEVDATCEAYDGRCPTMLALLVPRARGQRAVVELRVARGADQSIKDVRYQSTAPGWARHMGRDEVV